MHDRSLLHTLNVIRGLAKRASEDTKSHPSTLADMRFIMREIDAILEHPLNSRIGREVGTCERVGADQHCGHSQDRQGKAE